MLTLPSAPSPFFFLEEFEINNEFALRDQFSKVQPKQTTLDERAGVRFEKKKEEKKKTERLGARVSCGGSTRGILKKYLATDRGAPIGYTHRSVAEFLALRRIQSGMSLCLEKKIRRCRRPFPPSPFFCVAGLRLRPDRRCRRHAEYPRPR